MGRKRKTRWRHLSIGEVSGNEDEEAETNSEVSPNPRYHYHKSHSLNSIHRYRSASQSSINTNTTSNSTYLDKGTCTPAFHNFKPKMSTSLDQSQSPENSAKSEYQNGKESDSGNSSAGTQSQEEGTSSSNGSGSGSSGGETYHHPRHNGHYFNNSAPHYHSRGGHHNNFYHRYNSYSEKDRHSSYNGHHPSEYTNYYHRSHSYNGYRNPHFDGVRRGGGSEYYFPRSFSDRGGRFRKPRPFSTYNFYGSQNGQNGSSCSNPSPSSSNGESNNQNTPSYNQEEYTKITTPRQDVLFKKGYLSQRKPVTQSSSLESTSTATTPTASTNGTPDTHSTTGINSDYSSEGYETESCGALAPPQYDDSTLYYGPPAEAVFTDPNTGQVYYGQCSSNGEYFDAYPLSPVMLPGYPGQVFLAYPGIDWNGVPQLIPIVAAAPAPVDENVMSGAKDLENGDSSTKSGKKKGELHRPATPPSSASTPTLRSETNQNGKGSTSETPTTNGEITEEINSDSKSSSSTSAKGKSPSTSSNNNNNHSTSASSKPTTPLSSTRGQQQQNFNNSLPTLMSNLTLNNSPHQYTQHGPMNAALPPPPPTHLPNYLAHVPAAPHHQQHNHHHHQGPPPPPTNASYLIPHPSGFVYAPPIYNGVVVPIAPAASATSSSDTDPTQCQGSLDTSNRKKRKKRRRKKDDVNDQEIDDDDDDCQLTDESFEDFGGDDTNPDDDYDSNAQPQEPALVNPPTLGLFLDNTAATNTVQEITIDLASQDDSVKFQPLDLKDVDGQEQPSNVQRSALNKKAANLPSLNSLKSTGESQDLQCLQISPTLEPSSPDSFNTTQSVAGSEIPSVSESDLMNRTTSLDEVEEDLPIEEEGELKSTESKAGSVTEKIASPSKTPSQSKEPKLFITALSKSSPSSSEEGTPSPEISFENLLEPASEAPFGVEEPVKSVRIPLENLYFPPQDSNIETIQTPVAKEEVFARSNTEPEILHVAAEEAPTPTILVKPESEPAIRVQELPSINQLKAPESAIAAPDRPKSITLAVTEWLKTQGEDALTPASQLIAQFAAAEAHDADIDDDDGESDEDDQIENEGVCQSDSEQNQKNVQGNPWVVVSFNKRRNKKSVTEKRNTVSNSSEYSRVRDNRQHNNYYRKPQRSVPRNGTDSRVAGSPASTNSSYRNTQPKPCEAPNAELNRNVNGNCNYGYRPRNPNSGYPYRRDYRAPRDRSYYGGQNNRPPLLNSRSFNRSGSTNDEDSGLDLSSPEHLPNPVNKTADNSTPIPTQLKSRGTGNKKAKRIAEDLSQKDCGTKPSSSGSSSIEEDLLTMSLNEEASPSSCPNSSPPESLCDPQKFTKYYQFGIVVEEEAEENKEKDQGVDLESPTTSSPPTSPTTTPPGSPINSVNVSKLCIVAKDEEEPNQTKGSKKKKKKKKGLGEVSANDNEKQSVKPLNNPKVTKMCDFPVVCEKHVLVEDEEIGTFDPQLLKKNNRIPGVHSFGLTNASSVAPEINYEDYKEFVQTVAKSSPHLYVNPMSLAAELVYTANAKKVKLPDSWDVDSVESPLPIYESPPPPNLLNYPAAYSPVFSQLTPREKLIRTQLPPYGCCSAMTSAAATGALTGSTSSPVCCSIQ